MAHKSPLPETVEEVEALAGRQTLALALEVGTHEVELEGDAGVALGKSEMGDRALSLTSKLGLIPKNFKALI